MGGGGGGGSIFLALIAKLLDLSKSNLLFSCNGYCSSIKRPTCYLNRTREGHGVI